jgi:DNA-binding transcriptional ArsR family regulator/catechol 2,3-dioxygenase-like lactoylglutathione lyase family enzyme
MHPFTVVADPVRRRIVEVLAGGERSAGEVVEIVGGEFGISQSAVSQQLKVLRDHGFAHVRPEGARRIYSLEPTAVGAMDEWLRAVSGFWADRLDDLAAEVERRPAAIGHAHAAASAVPLGAIASVTRTVRDIAESEAFYGDAVGLPRLATTEATAAFDGGGTRLLLVQRASPAADESLLTFAVQDLAASMERMRAAGVVFLAPPEVTQEPAAGLRRRAAYFADPEGRPLVLVPVDGPPT